MTKPSHIYTEDLDDATSDQYQDCMDQPFVIAGALMSDAHLGYVAPIGSVLKTKGVVVPAYAGYDLCCGVATVRTNFDIDIIEEHALDIMNMIYSTIPTGFAHRSNPVHIPWLNISDLPPNIQEIYHNEQGNKQLGTLGGNNHFIEIGRDPEGYLCITVHTGSRGIGYKIAKYYMQAAAETKPIEGHWTIKLGDRLGEEYLRTVQWLNMWTTLNRLDLINQVKTILENFSSDTLQESILDCVHNEAVYIGNDQVIHRKGAISAPANSRVVIPGDRSRGVFIGMGKGNQDSLYSCSHGAGRVLSRKASTKLSLEDYQRDMQGITGIISERTLEEAPAAYKDIYKVMDMQRELVEPLYIISPIISIKALK